MAEKEEFNLKINNLCGKLKRCATITDLREELTANKSHLLNVMAGLGEKLVSFFLVSFAQWKKTYNKKFRDPSL